MRILKFSLKMASSCGSCSSVVHGQRLKLLTASCKIDSDKNEPPERERTPLSLQKEVCYNVGPTSLSDAGREASVSADFSKKMQQPVPVRSVCLCISLRWKSRSVCASFTGLLRHVRYSASTLLCHMYSSASKLLKIMTIYLLLM